MLMWKTATTVKMLLCFNLTITLAIAFIEEGPDGVIYSVAYRWNVESKPQLYDEDTHHIACVQRRRLEETCKVGPWLECPPDSHKDRTRASTSDASEYRTLSTTDPPAPMSTQDHNPHMPPSPARGRNLYFASRDGNLERVKRILATGNVNINTRGGSHKRTPVMVAAWKGHRDVVEFLVGSGADVSLVDRFGNNVVHLSSYGGHLETVKLIFSMNIVDINARTNEGKTPADWARHYGHQQV